MGSRSFVVVGSGIAGAFTAYFLARRGVAVTLVERGEIGGEASGNNPGGLNPLHGPGIPGPMGDLALASFRLHAEVAEDVRRSSGIDFASRPVARVHLAFDDRDLHELAHAKAPYETVPGFAARWIERDELLAREPRLDRSVLRGLETEGNLRVDPGAYTRAVARAASHHGARMLRGEVRGLVRRSERILAVVVHALESDEASEASEADTIGCDGVVFATGPWSAEPASWLDCALPIEPVQGEMLLVETETESEPVRLDLVWREAALYPTGGRTLWVGGTERRVGFDREPSDEGRSILESGLRRLLPEIGAFRVLRRTAALRPVTPDGFPIVGMASGWENACLALGGGRKGMLLAPAMGRATADLLLDGTTDAPIDTCAPARFLHAASRRGRRA